MRESKWKKTLKGKAVIGIILVFALIVGAAGGMSSFNQGLADEVVQETDESKDGSAIEGVSETEEGSAAEIGSEIIEGAEAESSSETDEGTETENADTQEGSEAANADEGGENQEIGEELNGVNTRAADGLQTLAAPVSESGINLYSGPDMDNFIQTYTTWNELIAGINSRGAGEYSIDLCEVDLTPATANWSTAFNNNASTGANQYYLHFYSSTGNTFSFSDNSTIGAHVEFHSGLKLTTPTAGNYGRQPLNSQTYGATDLYSGYASNCIFANGWRFIVNKGVEVRGAANLYAGSNGSSSFNYGKTVENGLYCGYVEVNAGDWRYIGASHYSITGAYRIIIGNDDDPNEPVNVDAVFGMRAGTMNSNDHSSTDIPSEYIEVTGNTVVQYGIAALIYGGSSYSAGTNVQKVVVGGNVSVLKTWGAVDQTTLEGLSEDGKNNYIRTSVTAGSVGNGYGHFNSNNNIVNIIVEIRDNAYIAGDVVGTGANMYFNVSNNSKGIHISVTDYAQIGGNVAYGGSSSAATVLPNDSETDPFFTMEVVGASSPGDVKIGGHLLATNGEDNSNSSSWAVATRVKNATVNGSVFGYGNLANQSIATGIRIKNAAIDIENSIIGGGVYGVATGNGRSSGNCTNISITINNSTVGHVAPLFTFSDSSGGGNASDYEVGGSNVNVTNSVITGRTVMWRTGSRGNEAQNLTSYSFVSADNSGTKTQNLKALATITVTGGSRGITFNTDGYAGIELATDRPEISLTTSMNARANGGMDLADYTISLASTSGSHTFSVADTDFTRTNGNPLIVIMDKGDGTLGKNATVTIDNCHATANDKKINASVFGQLSGTVTGNKVEEMTLNLKNTNDLAAVGFAQSVTSAGSYYINTKATIIMDNTVVDNLFGKGGGNNEQLRNAVSDSERVQFQFKNHNTLSTVEANGADVVFCENSVTYLSGFFNNTGSSVFDKEYVETESGAHVYLGNTGASATRHTLGDAQSQRVVGSISGTAGELYIYKDTIGGTANATYPVYVAEGGSILEEGMNLGEWSSSDGTIATADKDAVLDASSGKNRQYTLTEPSTSKSSMTIQAEHDIVIAFGTTQNSIVGRSRINDIPLRPWPIIRYADVNSGVTGEQSGWLVLGKPRYQVIYQGSGVQADNANLTVEGKIGSESLVVRQGIGEYLYMLEDDNGAAKSYTIEDYTPTATESDHYTFLYWRLYGSTEGSNSGENASGELIPDNWSIVAEEGINNSSGENSWVIDDVFTLKSLLDEGALSKENSKVLTLVPVYRANYVCKIGDQGYLELSDAFTAISSGTAAAETDGSYQIKMLVEKYSIDQVNTIESGLNVTITTAGESDTTLPYEGTPGTSATLIRSDESSGYSGNFFVDKGTFSLTNIILDGNSSNVSGDAFIKAEAGANLNLLSGSILQNNQTNDGMLASAVSAADATSTIRLSGTVIQNNVVQSNEGGGAIVSGTVVVEGKVVVSENYRKYPGESDVKSNICLDVDGSVRVEGSLSTGSAVGIRVQPGNHVDEYEFATTSSEAIANDSYPYFSDDFEDSLAIMVSTSDPNNIMFKGSVPFSFTKVKAEDTSEILSGVEFELYKLICEDPSHDHTDPTALVTQDNIGAGNCWELAAAKTSGETGLVDFENLDEGTYMLVETKAASGYKLPAGQWMIKVIPTGSDKIVITAHGDQDDLPPAFMIATESDGTVAYKLPNIRQLSLPFSGMPGIRILLIVGVALILLTTLLYILRKRSYDRCHKANKKLYVK